MIELLKSKKPEVDEFLHKAFSDRLKAHASNYLNIAFEEGERPLNDNIVGKVVDYYQNGDWFRVKVIDYEPCLGLGV